MRQSLLNVGAIAVLATTASVANAAMLAQWTFDNSINPTNASSYVWYRESGPYFGMFTIDTGTSNSTFSSPAGNGSAYGVSADRWSQGSYVEIGVYGLPSDLNSFTVSWDQTRATFGPADFRVDVSYDGYSTFTTLPNSDYTSINAGAIGSGTNAWSVNGGRQSEFTHLRFKLS
jgi:hypothetical protein